MRLRTLIRKYKFLLTRPSRDVTKQLRDKILISLISTHTSLAGRDAIALAVEQEKEISTHTSLAGRDRTDFKRQGHQYAFLLTRPSRDVTMLAI